jgi:hypothetical protein
MQKNKQKKRNYELEKSKNKFSFKENSQLVLPPHVQDITHHQMLKHKFCLAQNINFLMWKKKLV